MSKSTLINIDVPQIIIDHLGENANVVEQLDDSQEYRIAFVAAKNDLTLEKLAQLDDAAAYRVAMAIDAAFKLGWQLRSEL